MQGYEAFNSLSYCFNDGGLGGHAGVSMEDKEVELFVGRYGGVEGVFLETPGFGHEAADAVALYG